jgi:hypothetical protein
MRYIEDPERPSPFFVRDSLGIIRIFLRNLNDLNDPKYDCKEPSFQQLGWVKLGMGLSVKRSRIKVHHLDRLPIRIR